MNELQIGLDERIGPENNIRVGGPISFSTILLIEVENTTESI